MNKLIIKILLKENKTIYKKLMNDNIKWLQLKDLHKKTF